MTDGPLSELDRMLIEHACRRTAIAYAHCLDFRDAEGLGALFAEDGAWDVPNSPVPLAGPKAISEPGGRHFKDMEAQQRENRHCILNFLVTELDRDTAKG